MADSNIFDNGESATVKKIEYQMAIALIENQYRKGNISELMFSNIIKEYENSLTNTPQNVTIK